MPTPDFMEKSSSAELSVVTQLASERVATVARAFALIEQPLRLQIEGPRQAATTRLAAQSVEASVQASTEQSHHDVQAVSPVMSDPVSLARRSVEEALRDVA